MRFRRSAEVYPYVQSNVWTSIGAPGTGIDLYQRSSGDGKFIVATIVILLISALVWLI